MTQSLLVFGHGYTASELSRRLLKQGWNITGATRDAAHCEALCEIGVAPRIWPPEQLNDAISRASHILVCIPPDRAGDPVLAGLGNEIRARAADLKWLGYLSTTAVYGNHDGGWVDEDTPLTPATERGKWRVDAENEWRDVASKSGLGLHIFRLAGIYGPGRGPFAKVRAGTARRIIKAGQVFSRIHVTDIAEVLCASMQHPSPGAIYNLCDDEAAPPQDVIAYAADLLGAPVPDALDFESADLSPMARSFYSESKRVRNGRIKSELGVKLRFPTYREGLQALLDQEIIAQK